MKDRLLEQFQNNYDRQTWQRTLLEVFGVREIHQAPVPVDETDKAICYELGRHATADNYEIGVFEYAMKPGHRVGRSRAGLRGLVSGLVRHHVDAALVVFHDEAHWRLSFVCDLKEEKTSPKRFTYVFGDPEQQYRTPVERFTTLAETKPTFANIREAFSVERLDKDFFDGYKKLYTVFCSHAPDAKEYRNYIKRMMGRIVFLWFLQKKGWLGGDRSYMQNLLQRSRERYSDTFLSQVLAVLFFDTLNERREDDRVNPILGEGVRIPYLNGGLFERDKLDRQGVDFPFECFERLFDFFSMYNFTVDENDPNDAEVGVDPEMLGHIFENLLEDNKDKGAYYTPKEVVQYMCRDSLAQYLKANATAIPAECIDALVNRYDASWMAMDDEDTQAVTNLIKEIKVCDPAIGSGAFPMGMLNELFNIRYAMYDHFGLTEAVTPYGIKRDILCNNIYGVDLDQGAVDIARLRFWLALVVDDTEKHPLPNLDYKIMQGNSLLESYCGVDLGLFWEKDDQPAFHPTSGKQGLVAEYFGISEHDHKQNVRQHIEEIVRGHIEEWSKFRPYVLDRYDALDKTDLPFFMWNVYFGHIVGGNDKGFDIVIGNPPYGASSTDADKRQYKMEYLSTSHKFKGGISQKGSDDTYGLFIEQGFNLLKLNGFLSYIVPMSIISSDSMGPVQTLMLRYCREVKVSSYAENPKPVFDNAKLATSIISFIKTRTHCERLLVSKMHRRRSDVSLDKLLNNQKFIEAGDFILRGRFPKISEQVEKNILSKITPIHSTLSKLINVKGDDDEVIYYRTAGGGYYRVITTYPTGSTAEKPIYVNRYIRNLVGAILSTNFFFWYYQVYADNHNLKSYEIETFPFPIDSFDDELIAKISAVYEVYLADIESHSTIRKTKRKNIDSFKEYKINKSKAYIDRLDDLICPVYGLTPEEIAFIKNYEIEFRCPDAVDSKNVE